MGEVAYAVRGAGAWIRIDRPQAMNALSPAVITGLAESLDEAEADDDVRAVVVTESGRAFCAGADLKAVRRMSSDDSANGTRAFLRETGRVLRRIEDSPKSVVAAVNGLGVERMRQLVHDGLEQPVDTGLRLELLASEAHGHSATWRRGWPPSTRSASRTSPVTSRPQERTVDARQPVHLR